MSKRKPRWHVNVVVEVSVAANSGHDAADTAERRIQAVLDRHAKTLKAVVGADYADVSKEDA